MGVAAMILYAFGFLLVVSLVFNCQLANRLKQLQQRSSGQSLSGDRGEGEGEAPEQQQPEREREERSTRSTSNNKNGNVFQNYYLEEVTSGDSGNGRDGGSGLEEPLLDSSYEEQQEQQQQQQPSLPSGVEESKQEADG